MKLVKQENPFGCGIACIAAVLNINYEKALKLFKNGKKRASETPNFYCKEMVIVLKNSGLNYQYKYLKKRLRQKLYQPNTIVFIKRSKKYPYGHYLIRVDHQWMDPWINLPNKNIKAGFRKRLPGKPIYFISSNR